MAEPGSRKAANDLTEAENLLAISKEGTRISPREAVRSMDLREELKRKGLKGFKRGGEVEKTGVYKLHKGEEVLTEKQAKKSRRQALYGSAVLAAMLLPIAAQAQTTNGAIIASSTGQNQQKVLVLGPGQLAVGQGFLSDPIARDVSGDCTMSGAGSFLCTKTNGVSFGTAATLSTGLSGATIPLNNSANIFSALNTFTGHIAVSAVPPVLTSCGTSPTVVGDDKGGTVTMGTGTPTGCVITFAAAYTSEPSCAVSWQATPLASQSYAVSTTAITLTQTATSSNKVNYVCLAQNGG